MIVNIQDFYSFQKKIVTGLKSYSEANAAYRSRLDENKNPTFHFAQLDRNKLSKSISIISIGFLNVFSVLMFKKKFQRKNYTDKSQMTHMRNFICVLMNKYQYELIIL